MSDNTGAGAASAAELLAGGGQAGGQGGADQGAQAQGQQGGGQGQQGGQDGAGKAAAEGASWLDGIDDPELKAWAQNKNFPGIKEALASQRGLETLLGRDKLPLPKDDKDAEGWDRVYKALGRPDDAAGYGLDKLEGADPAFAGEAARWFHEAGLSERQAKALSGRWNEFMDKSIAAQQAEREQQQKAEMADLRTEWGQNFDTRAEEARRATKALGLTRDQLSALEGAVGTKAFLQMFSRIGSHFAEDKFEGGEGGSRGFSMSIEQAQARIKTLMADTEWAKSYLAGDANKRAEMERLNRVASGTAA
jgi:hypothetical protein